MSRQRLVQSGITLALTSLLVMASPPNARASDGVLEINQACAAQTGCFPGDPPGFPVFITGLAGTSYRLTSDLSVGLGNNDTDGIFINTSRVTIDFNGFTLNGSSLGAIPGTGSGIAIHGGTLSGTAASYATLVNGSIRGWRGAAIANPEAVGVRVENMAFEFNGGPAIEVGAEAQIVGNRIDPENATAPRGIIAGDRSRIVGNIVSGTQMHGILCTDGCVVAGNTTSGNGESGIQLGANALVSGNSSNGNFFDGVVVTQHARVLDNTVSDNTANGIVAGAGAAISGNIVADNGDNGIDCGEGALVSGNVARSNAADGISVGAGSNVRANTAQGNGSFGLDLTGTSTAYSENTIVAPTSSQGTVDSGRDTGGNLCNASTTCP